MKINKIQCQFCSRRFYNQDGLGSHIRQAHKGIGLGYVGTTQQERNDLRALAYKINKVPDKITIPTEYMIQGDQDDG